MNRASAWIAQGAAGLLAGFVLVSAAGPLATDDLWWHLALGHAYADAGVAIEGDPHLHSALHAPPANAWLFDSAVARIDAHFGLKTLRGIHVLLLTGILLVVGRLLYVRSCSAVYAGSGTSLFIACAAYRLVQFRPDLITIGATGGLALLLFARRSAPTPTRCVLAVLLCALWSNLHPGFLLGPVLIATAAGGALAGALIGPNPTRAADRRRAVQLAVLSAVALLATMLNPDGVGALLRYFEAGLDSAGQAAVVDEWRGFAPFARPTRTLPPGPLAFGVFWFSLIATPLSLFYVLHRRSACHQAAEAAPAFEASSDLSLAALALLGLVAPFVAVRFLWLVLFPILLGADLWRDISADSARHEAPDRIGVSRIAVAAAFLSLAMVPLYWIGAERAATPRLSRIKNYDASFDTDRYSTHAVWFLADSEIEGRLFHPYFMGGFLDYWLAPKCQTFIDGSLNIPPKVLADYGRYQLPSLDDRERILDQYAIDFFVGVGLPAPPLAGRPWRYTTNDLAESENWMLVFRNLRSAVYMRRHPRNAENLKRIAAYYARVGVPFSKTDGLDVSMVLTSVPDWAIGHGVAPHDFVPLKRVALGDGRSQSMRPELRALARDRLAMTYAALDLCQEALDLDTHLNREPIAKERFGSTSARARRMQACRARLSGVASPRAIWLTPIEAGRIKGVQLKAPTRTRKRHALSTSAE